MLSYRDRGILLQMVKCCDRILSKIKDVTFEAFEQDEDLREIICFNLLQIGELAKNYSCDFIKEFSNVPWKQIKGMRDKVAHGYGTLDLDLVYNTSKTDVPELLHYCQNILEKA